MRMIASRLMPSAWSQCCSASCARACWSRVTPALCTTMSTPPCASCDVRAMRRRRIGIGHVARAAAMPPTSRATCAERRRRPRGDRGRPRARLRRASTRAVASPMPRAAPVTSATLPASGCVHGSSPSQRARALDVERLRGDERRAPSTGRSAAPGRRALPRLPRRRCMFAVARVRADLLGHAAVEAVERGARRGFADVARGLGRPRQRSANGRDARARRIQPW